MPETNPSPVNPQTALALIFSLRAQLDKLEALFVPTDVEDLDPKDPRNKVGKNLTERGLEVCYRLFDQGKTVYGVKTAMDISYGAANYRRATWEKAGGLNREKKPLN